MGKAGGVIGIIGGVFGFIAALFTLLVGGLGSAFEANDANTIVNFGWGGVLFSFLAIVFGAISFVRCKVGGAGLILSSILGIALGGTFVAICMGLSLIGGILAVMGKSAAPVVVDTPAQNSIPVKKSYAWLWILAIVAVVIVGLGVIGSKHKDDKPKVDPLETLANAQPSSLRPDGELAELFMLGSKNTDLQRDNKIKEIAGQIVQWQLPVYEVSKSGDGYKIQTHVPVEFGVDTPELVSAFIYINPRNDAEKSAIEALKTDDLISFKGQISRSVLRHIEIKPAILVSLEQTEPQPAQVQTNEPDNQEVYSAQAPEAEQVEAPAAEQSEECADGGALLFFCVTPNNKKIELCDSGATIDYSFGKLQQKPEMAVHALREKASTYQWTGMGRYMTYSVDVPNGNTTYSVFWSLDRISDDHVVQSGVNVVIKGELKATVNCMEEGMVNNLEGVQLKPTE